MAALELGVREFDAAVGGLGGCPFAGYAKSANGAPVAAGNACTEDLAALCEELGIATGIDLEKLIAVARMVEELVGHTLPGKIMKGGPLPALRRRAQEAARARA